MRILILLILTMAVIYGFTQVSTNVLIVMLAAHQLISLYLIGIQLKRLEDNQEELAKLYAKSTKTLTENQSELQKEIRRLE